MEFNIKRRGKKKMHEKPVDRSEYLYLNARTQTKERRKDKHSYSRFTRPKRVVNEYYF